MADIIVQKIIYLECVDIAKPVLYMTVYNQLCESQNLSTQMEGISEPTLLSLLGGESLDGLQVEVVVKMEIIKVLTVDEQVQHVITLSTHL